jgi:hypothetical protein
MIFAVWNSYIHPRCRTGGDDKEVLRLGGDAATKPSEGIYKSIAIGVWALPFMRC